MQYLLAENGADRAKYEPQFTKDLMKCSQNSSKLLDFCVVDPLRMAEPARGRLWGTTTAETLSVVPALSAASMSLRAHSEGSAA